MACRLFGRIYPCAASPYGLLTNGMVRSDLGANNICSRKSGVGAMGSLGAAGGGMTAGLAVIMGARTPDETRIQDHQALL
jgi:hypothetical protein